MTDQVYHQVQYPMKKAINLLKKVDLDTDPENILVQLSQDEKEQLQEFLNSWEGDRSRIVDFVNDLRQVSRTLI